MPPKTVLHSVGSPCDDGIPRRRTIAALTRYQKDRNLRLTEAIDADLVEFVRNDLPVING